MKWIKNNIVSLCVGIFIVYILYFNKYDMHTNFIEEVKNNVLTVFDEHGKFNFIQLISMMGLNFCVFYYFITILSDFVSGTKEFIRYYSKNLFSFQYKVMRILMREYIINFVFFIIILIGVYCVMFQGEIQLFATIKLFSVWLIVDLIGIYFIQRYCPIESVAISCYGLLVLLRVTFMEHIWIVIILLIIHIAYDLFWKEKSDV